MIGILARERIQYHFGAQVPVTACYAGTGVYGCAFDGPERFQRQSESSSSLHVIVILLMLMNLSSST